MPEKNLYAPLSVGEMARRSGVTVATIHFYESKGLIRSERTHGNQRRFLRSTLRRVAVIRVAQRAGISLTEIEKALSDLPEGRTPTVDDWKQLSVGWKQNLQARIDSLVALRDQLEGCIGCGCLSLQDCPLRNPEDRLGRTGSGAQLIDGPTASSFIRVINDDC